MKIYLKRKSTRNKSRSTKSRSNKSRSNKSRSNKSRSNSISHELKRHKLMGHKSRKQKRVRFLGGNGQCGNHVSLFNNKMVMGGVKRQKLARKKKGGSFSNFITNIVNPISFTTTSPTDQPAITNYYSSNATKI